MTDKFDKLNETFNTGSQDDEVVDITPVPYVDEKLIAKKKESEKKPKKDDRTKDYEYARGNFYSIVEKGQEALNGALELAQETESARAYEVAGQLIKSVSDAADKLIDLQKKMKDLEAENVTNNTTNVTNNAVFLGTTAELSKLLKQQKKDNE
tara:strand:- start:27 stop:485 length:459 start_codon:yes stop_codon:yes gene_type:complete